MKKIYLAILIMACVGSYFTMVSMCTTAGAEENLAHRKKLGIKDRNSVVYDLKNLYLNEKKLEAYIHEISELHHEDCNFIIQECKIKKLDPFIVLGVIKRESNFNTKAMGRAGEKGLGQLMENTARPVAENLGYKFDSAMLFNPEYNLKLTITQLSYLYDIYNKDINKTLTAYNRGQKGLLDYMNSGRSPYQDKATSDYSVKVLEYASEFKEEFEKFNN